ncbi:B-cell receptor CD22-like [Notolabrus celidotus]|uniref:B-cell receptor CD22-like n=1 Tax=Notolabrus celidotus TaxID=1203425 RepID=UPI00148FF261|nr:B-cell receptor CD22-like [Notolabrus celidotus]
MSGCSRKRCTLRITDLRESDSAVYKFRLLTDQPDGKYTGYPGVTLSVTDPDLQVQVSTSSRIANLKCHSSCPLPPHPSFIWYKNGERIQAATSSSYSDQYNTPDSYSCALQGHEDSPSPPVCAINNQCNRVTYTHRRICAHKGSSVDISCTYNSHKNNGAITSKFWFSPQLSGNWQSPSLPADLRVDSQYAGRVQVYETGSGHSALRISDLRESGSAEYRFRFTSGHFEWGSSLPGTTLTVTDAPKTTSVSVSPSGEVRENSSVTLTCSSDANPAANYTWYKNGNPDLKPFSKEAQLVFSSIQPSDSGEYHCEAKNQLGKRTSKHLTIDVKYAPKLPSVSVSPSAEIMENSSLTLTCSSHANPAAVTYTWYKNGNPDLKPVGKEAELAFSSIQPSDSGEYYCEAKNQLGKGPSKHLTIDVKYAPKLPSVSVSPSGEIMEGSSVNLKCSSDANPAANYTWYKGNDRTPQGSGPVFTINDVTSEHSGDYYCEADNRRGRQNATLRFVVVSSSMKSVAAGSISAIFLVIIFLLVILFIRRKRSSKETNQPGESPDNNGELNMASQSEPAEELCYASVRFSKNQEEALYSNFSPAKPNRPMKKKEDEDGDDVEYARVNIKSKRPSSRSRTQMTEEDVSALYSTVVQTPRV